MIIKIPLKTGDEQDALTKARYYYKYLSRPGKIKKAKRSYNKRFRRKVKQILQGQDYENY
jgi:hypothetical protein